ncbi:hypothetical protein [Rubripirellula lacrimiformis]|nr:hypothetical protein [Rubripirellula lacrimiformis]
MKVRCPRCSVSFVFAASDRATIVTPEPKSVTESSVMRILGDLDPTPAPPQASQIRLRPCPKCAASISETLAVCNRCQCYIGSMPSFMGRLA